MLSPFSQNEIFDKTNHRFFSCSPLWPEEEQTETAILAENIFNTGTKDTYAGKIIEFKNERQFRNFLFWRGILSRHSLNNTFRFMRLARPAAKETRGILANQVAELDGIE